MKRRKYHIVFRSSVTGKFVSAKYAAKRPKTTYGHRVKKAVRRAE